MVDEWAARHKQRSLSKILAIAVACLLVPCILIGGLAYVRNWAGEGTRTRIQGKELRAQVEFAERQKAAYVAQLEAARNHTEIIKEIVYLEGEAPEPIVITEECDYSLSEDWLRWAEGVLR